MVSAQTSVMNCLSQLNSGERKKKEFSRLINKITSVFFQFFQGHLCASLLIGFHVIRLSKAKEKSAGLKHY